MGTTVVVGAFVAAVTAAAAWLRRQEDDGAFDVDPSPVSRPGLRRLFDFGPGGWSEDGRNQPHRR